jgi:hypothetical protein
MLAVVHRDLSVLFLLLVLLVAGIGVYFLWRREFVGAVVAVGVAVVLAVFLL